MKTMIFIRHGESIANTGGVTMSHRCHLLSELGKAQARTLASALDLQPGQIVISEFLRTHETAQPFSTKVSMQPIIHSGLNEFSCLDPNLIEGNLEWQLAVYRSLDRTAQNGEEGETE